jgi:hypothetical protein
VHTRATARSAVFAAAVQEAAAARGIRDAHAVPRLVDPARVLTNEDGRPDREMLASEIERVVREFPELAPWRGRRL